MFHLCLAIIFFVLSPGVLLTLPPGSRGVFASGQTSLVAAAVHALVFMIAVHLLWTYVFHPTREGFYNEDSCEARGMKTNEMGECVPMDGSGSGGADSGMY